MTSEVGSLIASVEAARAMVLRCLENTTNPQAAFKPANTEWSIAEILEHLYLAELSGVTKVWAAASGLPRRRALAAGYPPSR